MWPLSRAEIHLSCPISTSFADLLEIYVCRFLLLLLLIFIVLARGGFGVGAIVVVSVVVVVPLPPARVLPPYDADLQGGYTTGI